MFDAKLLEIEDKKTKLDDRAKEIEVIKAQITELKDAQVVKLQEVAGLTRQQAEEKLLKEIETDSQEALMNRLRKLEQVTEEELEIKGRKIMSLAMTRFASSVCTDTTTSHV